ncbi:MAG: diacylglycerol kinase family lipid kinase [Solirubrobacterales bacterium]|nr:diacylglycerol kinase family lipid kinase [Solirubrobacterales bacterium]
MSNPISVIVNPSAGGGRASKVLVEVERLLQQRGADFTVTETRDLPHARQLAREAAQQGRTAAALGGDGLVGAVAAGCSESGGLLAILPGGRGNDLARVLGISTDPVEAVAIALDGAAGHIDMGDGNGTPFCCIASCGYDSDANRIANEARVPGELSYLYAAVKALISWKQARFTIDIDGESTDMRGFSVIVANSKAYGSGMFIAPDADLHDGLLDVVTIEGKSRLRFLALLPLVFKGRHVNTNGVTVRRGSAVRIEADRPFTVYADGDPLCDLPAVITVRPDACRVMLPSSA